ncbi:MAG: PaaI family thioesterase [Terracidiphilus sp.]
MSRAIQDDYPESLAYCYGCGRLNEHGHHIRTTWEGDETVCVFTPEPWHIAVPGFVYGGVLASLVDCHSTGTAAAAAFRAAGRAPGSEPAFRFVTASLHVDYLKPTPLGVPLTIRARVTEINERKVVVESTVYARGIATVAGKVVAVQIPASFGKS